MPCPPSDSDVATAPPGASLASLVRKATENERILRRYQQMELQLLSAEGLEDLLQRLLVGSRRAFSLDAVELRLFDPHGALAELLGDAAQAQPGLQLLSSDSGLKALYQGDIGVRLVSGARALAGLKVFAGSRIRSTALLPMVRQGRLVGSLHFGSGEAARFTADKSTDFIAHLASVAAICLENGVNREQLHRLSLMDTLTQVGNRRAFQRNLDTEIARALRQARPLSLLFVDLDHFKRINDRHGHHVGDQVLRAVARHIALMLRKTDHVCRFGGEEFALILPDCERSLALEVAERIRAEVAGLQVTDDEDQRVPVTLSIGVCCWASPDVSPPQQLARALLKAADHAVYAAKKAGRNRVCYQALTEPAPDLMA